MFSLAERYNPPPPLFLSMCGGRGLAVPEVVVDVGVQTRYRQGALKKGREVGGGGSAQLSRPRSGVEGEPATLMAARLKVVIQSLRLNRGKYLASGPGSVCTQRRADVLHVHAVYTAHKRVSRDAAISP